MQQLSQRIGQPLGLAAFLPISVNVTWCGHIWLVSLNIHGHILEAAACWSVIRTDKLNSSVQVCLAGSLHDYLTLLQVHTSFLILNRWGFLSYIEHTLSLKILTNKKKQKWLDHWTQAVHCHAYQVVRVALSFFVSQVDTVKYIQYGEWFSIATHSL